MERHRPSDCVSFYLPLLDADGHDLIDHVEGRLDVARKLHGAGWASRKVPGGIVFETSDVEVDIADRLAALGLPKDLITRGLVGGADAAPTPAEYYAAPPPRVRGSWNVESPWLRFGELGLPSGQLMIGDPLNPPQQHRSVHLPAGNYLLLVRAMSAYAMQSVTRIRVAMDLHGRRGEVIAEVPVDLDRVGFYDKGLGDVVSPAVPVEPGNVLTVREIIGEESRERIGIEVMVEGDAAEQVLEREAGRGYYPRDVPF